MSGTIETINFSGVISLDGTISTGQSIHVSGTVTTVGTITTPVVVVPTVTISNTATLASSSTIATTGTLATGGATTSANTGTVATTSTVSAATAAAGLPLSAAPALTGLTVAQRPVGVGSYGGNYAGWGVANCRAVGGVGPYLFSFTDSTQQYCAGNNPGEVSVTWPGQHYKQGALGPATVGVTCTDGLGRTTTSSFSVAPIAQPVVQVETDTFYTGSTTQSISYSARTTAGNPITPTGGKAVVLDQSTGKSSIYFVDQGYGDIIPIGALPPVGSYPVTIVVSDGTNTASTNITFQVVATKISQVYFTPNTISSSVVPGYIVGQAYASSNDNILTWALAAGSSPLFSINGTTGVVTTLASLAAGVTYTLNIQAIDQNTSVTNSFSFVAQTGVTLPSTSLTNTAVVANNLTNYAPKVSGGWSGYLYETAVRTVITNVLPAGINPATAVWTINNNNNVWLNSTTYQNGQLIAGGFATGYTRYEINPKTGLVTTRAQLSAQTDTVTVTVSDGINTCSATFSIVVTAVVGPTIYVGRGMSTTWPASLSVGTFNGQAFPHGVQGFETLVGIWQLLQGAGSGPNNGINPSYAGCTILVYPDSDPNYYTNDNSSAPKYAATQDLVTNGYYHYGAFGPASIQGVKVNGTRPRMGGIVGSPYSGNSGTGMAFLTLNVGDWSVSGIDFSDCHGTGYSEGSIPQNGNQICNAIERIGSTYGNTTVSDCTFTDCDQAIMAGDGWGTFTITNVEMRNCGGVYQGAGATHIMYLEGWNVILNDVLSYRTVNGHTLKSRAMNGTVTNCRLFDTARGSSSCQIELPDGGNWVVNGCTIQKGPMCQNPHSVQFCAEMSHDYPVNNLVLDNCTFINDCIEPVNAFAVFLFNSQSARSGNYNGVQIKNCSFWGYNGFPGQSNIGCTPYTNPVPTLTGNYLTGSAALPNETGSILLTQRPSLDFSHPSASLSRPGPIYYMYDGNGACYSWQYVSGVQIDPGSDDVTLSLSTAKVGQTVFTVSPTGSPYFAGSAVPQPDIRIQPFVSGTTYSLVYNDHNYLGAVPAFTYAVRPAGRYAINPSTGVVTVLSTAGMKAGSCDTVMVAATAPPVQNSNNPNVPNGFQAQCHWLVNVNITA